MAATHHDSYPYTRLLITLGVIAVAYVGSLLLGWPQEGTAMIAAPVGHSASPIGDLADVAAPPLWMVLPFVLLLCSIAIFPLTPKVSHWWESNLHKFYIAAVLSVLTLLYYLLVHSSPVYADWPIKHVTSHSSAGPSFAVTYEVFANAMFAAYVPFIVLLFSLYTISGGIRLEGDLRAHPATNTAFLALGSVLASVIGTTGAAMLLIRPLLTTNSERKHVAHTVVFFIFLVCNCGGCLLPTGDPPLFLGYLMGVPFLWTLGLWKPWLFIVGCLLVIYFLWDAFVCYPREAMPDIVRDESEVRPLRISGLWPNGLLLGLVIASVGLLDPSKPVIGTGWHPWLYLREFVQLILVGASLLLGKRETRQANNFTFGAIIEVAVLFFGIFVCMQPPLQVLNVHGPSLGLLAPWQYFWASGGLSSFLDNAPTYVVFFETAKSVTASNPQMFGPTVAATGVYVQFLIAVSLGSVFMGANTYIGNGPNFMVKTIAESSHVKMPGFFGYMLYSGVILIPLFAATTYLFLR